MSGVINSFTNFKGSLITGTVVQSLYSEYTANANLNTQIPGDDTIPQITEGVEFLTLTITPKKIGNIIEFSFEGQFSLSVAGSFGVALFIDATANALNSKSITCSSIGAGVIGTLVYRYTAVDLSAHTFRVRAGPLSASTLRMNGTNAARFFGGSSTATLSANEIAS